MFYLIGCGVLCSEVLTANIFWNVAVSDDKTARVALWSDTLHHNASASHVNVHFRTDGFNFGVEPPPCGLHKCLFRQRGRGDGVGFLLAPQHEKQDMVDQWKASELLRARYVRPHLLLGPPAKHAVPEDLAVRLNLHNLQPWRRLNERPDERNHEVSGRDGHNPIVFQSVRVAPGPTLLIGCSSGKVTNAMNEGVSAFLDASVKDVEGFLLRLKGELLAALRIMDKQPWYAHDWQALVNREGGLFNIDIAVIEKDVIGNRLWVDVCCDLLEGIFRRAAEYVAINTNQSSEPVAKEKFNWRANGMFDWAAKERSEWAPLRPPSWGDDLNVSGLDLCKCDRDKCTESSLSDPCVAYQVGNAMSDALATSWKMAKLLFVSVGPICHDVLGRPERVPRGEGEALLAQKILRRPPGTHFLFSCGGSNGPVNVAGLERFTRSIAVKDRQDFLRTLFGSAHLIHRAVEQHTVIIPSTFRAFVNNGGHI